MEFENKRNDSLIPTDWSLNPDEPGSEAKTTVDAFENIFKEGDFCVYSGIPDPGMSKELALKLQLEERKGKVFNAISNDSGWNEHL